jgi:hypothetical protein
VGVGQESQRAVEGRSVKRSWTGHAGAPWSWSRAKRRRATARAGWIWDGMGWNRVGKPTPQAFQPGRAYYDPSSKWTPPSCQPPHESGSSFARAWVGYLCYLSIAAPVHMHWWARLHRYQHALLVSIYRTAEPCLVVAAASSPSRCSSQRPETRNRSTHFQVAFLLGPPASPHPRIGSGFGVPGAPGTAVMGELYLVRGYIPRRPCQPWEQHACGRKGRRRRRAPESSYY